MMMNAPHTRFLTALPFVLLLIGAPSVATADPKAHYEAARKALDGGDAAGALASADKGLGEKPGDQSVTKTLLLWVKARALLRLNRMKEAWTLLQQVPPERLPVDQQELFVQVYEGVERRMSEQKRTAQQAAPPAAAPPASPAPARPPAPGTARQKAGQKTPEAAPRASHGVAREVRAPPTSPAPPSPSAPQGLRAASDSGRPMWPILVGGVVAASGGVLLALGASRSHDTNERATNGAFDSYPDYQSAQKLNSALYYSGVGLAIAGAAVVGWGALRSNPRPSSTAQLFVSPTGPSGGWQAAALLRF